ncbi:MAG TPA: hypothetical protein VGU20_05575 [Stellaceae bacterium]|nr:hypothetical protein [Stellaceae bacterium]
MVMNSEAHQKVTTAHLSRLAYLYVRQSTLRQVFENTESSTRYGSALSRWVGRSIGSSSSTVTSGNPAPVRLTEKASSDW